jgi:hypothetical protein
MVYFDNIVKGICKATLRIERYLLNTLEFVAPLEAATRSRPLINLSAISLAFAFAGLNAC